MEITESAWVKYINSLRLVNDKAAELIKNFLEKHGIPVNREQMNALIDYAYGVAVTYGEAAATLTAEMYDAIAALSGVAIEPAVPAPPVEISDVAKAVVGTSKTGNEEIISSAIGRIVKQTGVDTTLYNGIRDGVEWAWIPHGDTCAFCIALAANGWQRASKKALKNGHAEHIHANCDCTYAIRFNGDTKYAGYNPDVYRDMYDDADGRSPKEKINSMRRDFYAENSERINAQKRDNYEKRKERESSAAEELDV